MTLLTYNIQNGREEEITRVRQTKKQIAVQSDSGMGSGV
jgi:hypothetical protein